MADLFTPASLVHVAAIFYVAGFLVRDQVKLRGLLLAGTACYLVYYYVIADPPLWEAMFWSAVMGAANLFVLVQLLLERTTLALSDEEKSLYSAFAALSPGEFRRILKVAQWHEADGTMPLTVQGETCDRLFYVTQGDIALDKAGRRFTIGPETFIGEVAYFLRKPASATAVVMKGGRYVSIGRADLEEIERRHPAIRVAVHAMLSLDMAAKVAAS